MIRVAGVQKFFGAHQVLRDCTTQVAAGEVVVICGPYDSGKSTLVKCVNGLEPFDGGTIHVGGVSIGARETDLPMLRAGIGMVFLELRPLPAYDGAGERQPSPDPRPAAE